MDDWEKICPMCDGDVQVRTVGHRFQYGVGVDAAMIEVEIPVSTCTACDFEFTGWRAADMMDGAVARHLEGLASG